MWEVTIDTGHVDSDSSEYIAIACNGVTRVEGDSSMLPSRDVRLERCLRNDLPYWMNKFNSGARYFYFLVQ